MTSDSTGEIYVVQRTTPDGLGFPSGLPWGPNGGSRGDGGTTGGLGDKSAATGVVVPRSYEMFLVVGLSLTLSVVGGAFFAVA